MRSHLISAVLITMALVTTAKQGSVSSARSKLPPVSPPAGKIVDINSALAEDLEELPGIGFGDSIRIIKGRPYRDKIELATRRILPISTYATISNLIVAKHK